MIGDVPRLHFELQGLGERLHAMIMLQSEEISEAVKLGVQQCADSMDVPAIAREAARTAITKAVEEGVEFYFKHGEGRNAIRELIGAALEERR